MQSSSSLECGLDRDAFSKCLWSAQPIPSSRISGLADAFLSAENHPENIRITEILLIRIICWESWLVLCRLLCHVPGWNAHTLRAVAVTKNTQLNTFICINGMAMIWARHWVRYSKNVLRWGQAANNEILLTRTSKAAKGSQYCVERWLRLCETTNAWVSSVTALWTTPMI